MRIQKILSAKFEISSFSMGLAACGIADIPLLNIGTPSYPCAKWPINVVRFKYSCRCLVLVGGLQI